MATTTRARRPTIAKGLSREEASRRLSVYGPNLVYRKKRLRPIIAFVKKFNSPLLLMLIGTSIVSLFLGQSTNAIIILVMVSVSTVMDFINTRKSESVAEKLASKVAATASVRRDGELIDVPLADIVPGDVVELVAGNVVPADCRLVSADDFFVNQSSLTGESYPVEKRPADVAANALEAGEELLLSDESAIFMGTSVVTGFGTAIVLRTGANAYFGRIAERLAAKEDETDFERGIKQFSYFIVRLTSVMVIAVFAINMALHHGLLDSFLFSVAIAVGLTPELLPVIMSVSLARGSLVMSTKQVIVKNLSSIQNFGSMDLLCTDKTGTLTEDRIALVKCVDWNGRESDDVLLHAYLSSMMHTAKRGPLDEAIEKHGKMDIKGYAKVDEIPFDFHRRLDSVVIDHDGGRVMISKGAPESILSNATRYVESGKERPIDDAFRVAAYTWFDQLSEEGYRVLAISRKSIPAGKQGQYHKEEEKDMAFLGFAAFLDPPKQSAAEAIRELQDLAIEVKIVTGDSEILTMRICHDLGLAIRGVIKGGEELRSLSDSELARKAETTTVFARVSPEEKERIITVLRKAGRVVGYMGDGINDAPVLKAADVGISVNNAVDVAKETADIILLTKSLKVLKDGVIEGRKTFQNTLKYIKIGFSSNFGNMFSMMAASAVLPFLPMLPSQILLNNFLYDMSQMTLSTDATDPRDTRRPLRWDTRFFGRYVAVFGLVSSIFDILTFYLLYKVFALPAGEFQAGWFIESIATQALVVHIIRTKVVPFWRSVPSLPVLVSTIGIVALSWVIPFSWLGRVFSFGALPGHVVGFIVAVVAVYLIVAEVTKAIFYRFYPKAP